MLRRLVISMSLTGLLYFWVVIVVFAQNPRDIQIDRLQDQNRQIEQQTTSNMVMLVDLEREIREIQNQKLGERMAVMEATANTNLKLLIGLSFSMFPILIDVFRRWSTRRLGAKEVEVDHDSDE